MEISIVIAICSIMIHLFFHRGILSWLKLLSIRSESTWICSFLNGKLFGRIVFLIQGVVIGIQFDLWLTHHGALYEVLLSIVRLWVVLFSMLSMFSFLDIVDKLIVNTQVGKNIPTRGIIQSIKIIVFIVSALFFSSIVFGKSPLILLSGLGAMTAVLMLVFKDPILGLVAGVQLSANKMLNVGDWLEMPKYGADGDVIDISLTTVKVQNWDKTITTIPTYALISDSFKNWKGMTDAGGRRIKRSFYIDSTSVHFINDSEINEFKQIKLLENYLQFKIEEISNYNNSSDFNNVNILNFRNLTNIGCFRVYLERYLSEHKEIRQDMTLMVRQLPPTHYGISIEIYCFTNTTAWLEYERIQSDIFDHIYAILPSFYLSISQAPIGKDFHSCISNSK
ncbi:mechanosensitive ion channel family protein [Vibrio sp. E150_018]